MFVGILIKRSHTSPLIASPDSMSSKRVSTVDCFSSSSNGSSAAAAVFERDKDKNKKEALFEIKDCFRVPGDKTKRSSILLAERCKDGRISSREDRE